MQTSWQRRILTSILVAEKYLLVPDCDDDRTNHLTNEPTNPRHRRAQAEVYGSGRDWQGKKIVAGKDIFAGWYPPRTLRIIDGVRSDLPYEDARENEKLARPRFYRAGVLAKWFRYEDGVHRIIIIGGDDTSRERDRLTEKKAATIWGLLNDFVTIKTLWRLKFVTY